MPLGRLVKGGADDLGGVDLALPVRYLLGPLVNEQYDEVGLAVVLPYAARYGLKEHGLSGPRGGHYHATLAHARGGYELHHPGAILVLIVLELELLSGIIRSKVIEERPFNAILRGAVVHCLHLQEGEVALVVLGGADLP